MNHLPLVIWLIGWPLSFNIQQYLIYKASGKETNVISYITALIIMVTVAFYIEK